ncbi:hypothetical protein OROHE_006276 [Orobanche hederae]
MAYKIRVLLVEHVTKDHDRIKNMLEHLSYEVTTVKLVSTALSILLTGKAQLDVVMANVNSPDDMDGFELLREAVKMNLLVILMSNDDDAMTTMRALEQGAFLCINKPIEMQIMEHLWEHVVREKANTLEQHEEFGEQVDERTKYHNAWGRSKTIKKFNLKISKNENVTSTRKVWTRWTKELHDKFMDAVAQLGEGRCFPKEILQLMNVPGLTRMQVASHLQICRNASQLPLSERKSKHSDAKTTRLKNKVSRQKIMKVGYMPRLGAEFELDQGMQEDDAINQELDVDNIPPGGEAIVLGDYKHEPSFDDDERNNHGYNNNPVAQNSKIFNMGQLMQSFLTDEILMCHTQNTATASNMWPDERVVTEDTFDQFPNLDDIIQDLFTLQQELGTDYSGSLESVPFHRVNHNQVGLSLRSQSLKIN